MTLSYENRVSLAANVTTGAYYLTTNELRIGLVDSDGEAALAPPVGTEISIAYRDPFNSANTKTITVTFASADPDSIIIMFTVMGSQPAPGIGNDDTGLTYSVTTPEVSVTHQFWARRNDFNARDFVQSGQAGLVTINDSVYVVRHNPIWAAGVSFTDEEGNGRTIQGVSQYSGRADYLELLARRVGA